MNRATRYQIFIDHFEQHMPNPTTELVYRTPFELLIAVILSAQCRDKRVNEVTPGLFRAYPTPEIMAKANYDELLEHIRAISYPRSKANYLIRTSQALVDRFGGRVPDNMEHLQQLHGVGRKSASVIMAVIHNQPAMPVDTHVIRVTHRLGLVSPASKTPLKIEREIRAYVDKRYLTRLHHWMVLFGRYRCKSIQPKCSSCPFQQICGFFQQRNRPSTP